MTLRNLGFQVKDESYGFSTMPEVELPRLEAHFARKKEGGIFDLIKQAAGVSGAANHGQDVHQGRGESPLPRRGAILLLHASGKVREHSSGPYVGARDED